MLVHFIFDKIARSSRPEVFLGKGVLKICSKFTEEHPCRSEISINLMHIFRTLFPKSTSGRLLLNSKMSNIILKTEQTEIVYVQWNKEAALDVIKKSYDNH